MVDCLWLIVAVFLSSFDPRLPPIFPGSMTFCVDKTCSTRFQTLIACPLYPSNPIAIGSPLNLGETFVFLARIISVSLKEPGDSGL